MKKILSTFVLVGVASLSAADKSSILSINPDYVLANSKAGKNFFKEQEALKTKAETELRASEQKVRSASQLLEKQAPMLTQEALVDKQMGLARDIRQLKRDHEEREQDLKAGLELGVKKLRSKLYVAAMDIFKNEKASMLVDKTAPGVLAVAADLDISKQVLEKVDMDFEKSTVIKKEGINAT